MRLKNEERNNRLDADSHITWKWKWIQIERENNNIKKKIIQNQDKRIKDQTVLMSDDHVSMKSGWFTFIDFDFRSSFFFFIECALQPSTPRLFPPRFLYHLQANYFSFVVIIVFFHFFDIQFVWWDIYIYKKRNERTHKFPWFIIFKKFQSKNW